MAFGKRDKFPLEVEDTYTFSPNFIYGLPFGMEGRETKVISIFIIGSVRELPYRCLSKNKGKEISLA